MGGTYKVLANSKPKVMKKKELITYEEHRTKSVSKAEALAEGDELDDIVSVDVDVGSMKHKDSISPTAFNSSRASSSRDELD